jgi:hypothetical protein
MLHIRTTDLAVLVGCVKAVAFRQPMLKCSGLTAKHFARWFISGFKLPSSRASMRPPTSILHTSFERRSHLSIEVRQIEKRSRAPDRQSARRVEREEPHARLAIADDIRAHVEFQKSIRRRDPRQPTRVNAIHQKRDHSKPRAPVEAIQNHPLWQLASNRVCIRPPVNKRQMFPAHMHRPRPLRQKPGAMRGMFKNGRHVPKNSGITAACNYNGISALTTDHSAWLHK